MGRMAYGWVVHAGILYVDYFRHHYLAGAEKPDWSDAINHTDCKLPEMFRHHSGQFLSLPTLWRNHQAQLPELQPGYRTRLDLLPLL